MIKYHLEKRHEEKQIKALLEMGLRDPNNPFRWIRCTVYKCNNKLQTFESKRSGICWYHSHMRELERKRLATWQKQQDEILKMPENNDFQKFVKMSTNLDHLRRKRNFVKGGKY